MRLLIVGTILSVLSALVLIAPHAYSNCGGGGGGESCDLTLVVEPNDPVGGGDVVSVTLSDGHEGHQAFLAVGWQLGTYKIYGWTLDLIPVAHWRLGAFPASCELAVSFTLPSQIPPSWSGRTLHIQGTSVGQGCCGWKWNVSNLDSIEFK